MGLSQMELANVTMFTFCSCYYTKEITCFKQNINCEALRDLVFCNIKNVKNTDGEMLLLVKLQVEAYNLTKSNTP